MKVSRRALDHAQVLCWTLGLLCLLLGVASVLPGRGAVEAVLKPSALVKAQRASLGHVAAGASLGTLHIPALPLAVPIVEDDDTQSLLHGLGHIRGTAVLGGLGTTALAGHRDTFLRPIRRIQVGMEILATTPSGTYHYLVDRTEIVDPTAVQVLETGARPELVIITCYPFSYIGPAPQRFIVHAHLVSAAPDGDRP